MDNSLWYEMIHTKYGEEYLTRYLGFQHTAKRCVSIATLIISVSGILQWKFFENYTWIFFIIIAIMQLVTLVENQLFRSSKEIENITKLKSCYVKYYHKLEITWKKKKSGLMTADQALEEFYKIKGAQWPRISKLSDELNIKHYGWLKKQADKETREYVDQYLTPPKPTQ